MEELLELRRSIDERRYVDALLIVDELEEMSRDDKINRMDSSCWICRIFHAPAILSADNHAHSGGLSWLKWYRL